MFGVSDEMKEIVQEHQFSAPRNINIGVHDVIDRSFVIATVNPFIKEYKIKKQAKLHLIAGEEEELVEKLRSQELDAIITESGMKD